MNIKKIIFACTLFAILVGFRYYLDDPYVKTVNPGVESIFDLSVNMASVLFGETRKTMAAVLWGRVLIYHTETSHAPAYGPRKDVKIPDNMFTYEGTQILPILRLITWLDNNFINAYDFGGYFLAINLNSPEEGIDFLKEGITYNSNSYDLKQGLAFIYFIKKKDYQMAVKYGKEALLLSIKLPDDNVNKQVDCKNSLRIIGHSYRKLGDMDSARKYFSLIAQVDPTSLPEVEQLMRLKQED